MTNIYPRLVVFDLDGVLIDSKEIHYQALNTALHNNGLPVITKEQHLSVYDGLPTKEKMKIYQQRTGLPVDIDKINAAKQHATNYLLDNVPQDQELIDIFRLLRTWGYNVAIASNSIRDTTVKLVYMLGLSGYVQYICSNEDVKRPKPYPEMYWQCMRAFNTIPSNTWIVEDSHIGRQGVIDSGAHLIAVNSRQDVTLDFLNKELSSPIVKKKLSWKDNRLNVLIPMAGDGSRFTKAGYTFPKPLIEVRGKPMIQVVVENLNIDARYTFIVKADHYKKYNLESLLHLIAPGCNIIQLDETTSGAAVTTLLARDIINTTDPLLIANSDQFIEWNANQAMYAFSADPESDAGILTFKASHPKWSYAKVGENGLVTEVAEKRIISDNATCGVYYWKHGFDYVKYANLMISKDIRVNNEFYVCPVFNEAIQAGKKVRIKQVEKMWGIGTPEDLNYFLENYKGEV